MVYATKLKISKIQSRSICTKHNLYA